MTIYRPIGDVYGYGPLPAYVYGASMQWSDDDPNTYVRINPGDAVTNQSYGARAPYGESLAAAAGASELYISIFIDGGISDTYKPTNFGIGDGATVSFAVQNFDSLGPTTQGWVEYGPFTNDEHNPPYGCVQAGMISDLATATGVFAFFNGGLTGNENYTYITEFAVRLDGPAAPFVPPVLAHPSLRMLQRGGTGGMSGIWRMVGNPTTRDSLRRGPGSIL